MNEPTEIPNAADPLELLRRGRSEAIDLEKHFLTMANALEATGQHAIAIQLGLVAGTLARMVHGLSELIAEIGADK